MWKKLWNPQWRLRNGYDGSLMLKILIMTIQVNLCTKFIWIIVIIVAISWPPLCISQLFSHGKFCNFFTARLCFIYTNKQTSPLKVWFYSDKISDLRFKVLVPRLLNLSRVCLSVLYSDQHWRTVRNICCNHRITLPNNENVWSYGPTI